MAKAVQKVTGEIRFNSTAFAEAYNKYLVPYMFSASSSDLLQHLPISHGQKILDVGCGTGAVTWQLAPLVGSSGEVIGIDPNEAMLEVAKKQKLSSVIPKWVVSTAENLPVSNQSVDVITCQHVIQFCKDYNKVFKEFQRVLKPGGKLGLTVWVPDIARQPFFSKQEQMYTDLNYTFLLDGFRQPLSFKGNLKLLQQLAEEHHFEINQIYEKPHIITFPDYKYILTPAFTRLQEHFEKKPEEYQKAKENILNKSKEIFNLESDGKSLKVIMPAYVLIATRKKDSKL